MDSIESFFLLSCIAGLLYYILYHKLRVYSDHGAESKARITELWIYPIKSCAGISMDKLIIGERGFLYDRNWMVVEEDGTFMTQREYPKMCLITTKIEDNKLILNAPGMRTIEMPLTGNNLDTTDETNVSVFRQKCLGIDEGHDMANWFTEYLGTDARLVRYSSGRDVNQRYRIEKSNNSLGFADEFPFLLISDSSVQSLNKTVRNETITKMRFRPNIIISGTEAWKEEEWTELFLGRIKFTSSKACKRCILTTVNPEDGTMSETKEPFSTIFKKETGLRGMFGITLQHETNSIGDYLSVDMNVYPSCSMFRQSSTYLDSTTATSTDSTTTTSTSTTTTD